MKRLLLMVLLMAAAGELRAQQAGNATLVLFPGVPFGTCNSRQLAINQSANTLYTCAGAGTGSNGTWQLVSGGGGLSNFSSGNLSPLFTTVVATPTTTPSQTFTLSTAPANTMFANNSGTAAAPSWVPISGGGGSGTVTTFSVSNLSPIFTASVANPTTTPALSFTLSNAPANSMLGNSSTTTAGPPTWIPIPSGSGGGTSLAGCTTPTAGNFECDHSLSATVGNEGLLSMPYAGLPSPPATKLGQLAADASGAPYWSIGNGNPFAKLMVADPNTGLLPMSNIDVSSPGGLGSIAILRNELTQCNMMGWSVQGGVQTCADLIASVTSEATHTITSADTNRVLLPSVTPLVTYTLLPPADTLKAPFTFWVDTRCGTSAEVTAVSGALINGLASLTLPTCGWAQFWADSDGVDWHAQAYIPPGGVNFVQ